MAKTNDLDNSLGNSLGNGISAMQPMIDSTAAHSDSVGVGAGAGVVLREDKCLGYINLRLGADNAKGATAVADVLGTPLPALEKVATSDKAHVLGISPSEWLIITASGAESATQQALEQALAGEHSLVADVTGGTTLLNISGAHAQDLLEKGTYVDLHHSAFQAGQFYNTQIAHAPAMIVKNADNDFSLVVRRSFSHHIAAWAVDGAHEYGVTFS